jgi:hemerythrin-like domain-containing protein
MASKSSKMLSSEHENILIVVDVLEQNLNGLTGKGIDKNFFEKVIGFIKNYSDKLHHAKEEDILFKEFDFVAERGGTHCNPTKQMLYEHDHGRESVKLMEEGIEKDDKEKLIQGAKEYIQLIRDHIFKEDNILYPMADEALSEEIKENIFKKFQEINETKKEEIKKYEEYIKNLKKLFFRN